MDQAPQGNNPDASADILQKRKRGRPRKYPKLSAEDNIRAPKIQKINREENVGLPPGFGGVNGNQPRQVAATNDARNDAMVGRAVSGVIEAVFDAGYLLNVRVANSDVTLRGVVFKPGRFVPVSRENDVAPNIQMIRRNEIPLPTEHSNARPREKKEQQANARRDGTHSFNESPAPNQVPRVASNSANHAGSKGSKVPSVAVPPACPDPITARGKQVQGAAHPASGSTSTNQVLKAGSQEVLSQSQTSHQPMSEEGVLNKNNGYDQPPAEMLLNAEANSMKLPGMPFEKLVTEVIKRIEAPSQSAETQIMNNKSADKISVKDAHKIDNVDQALAIEPLQAVQPRDNNHPSSAPAPKPMEDGRTSKMSQLLEVVQETSQANPIEESASTQTFSEMASLATNSGDKERNQ